MKRSEVQEEAISGVNIIPVIDVTLVLLVILLVMSPVLDLPKLNVDLPEAMTKETKDENLTVSLTADGKIGVDNDVTTLEDLPRVLKTRLAGRKDAVVIVRADKALPYGAVEKLLRTVNRHVGNRAVAVATRQRSARLEAAQP